MQWHEAEIEAQKVYECEICRKTEGPDAKLKDCLHKRALIGLFVIFVFLPRLFERLAGATRDYRPTRSYEAIEKKEQVT